MRQKSDPTPIAAEKLVRDICGATKKEYSAEARSLSFVGAKTSPRACIISGRRSFLKPANAGSRGTPHGRYDG
jgi:hypothetical protein